MSDETCARIDTASESSDHRASTTRAAPGPANCLFWGVVAFLDALGLKAIWQQEDSLLVVDRLSQLRAVGADQPARGRRQLQMVNWFQDRCGEVSGDIEFHVASFSDTFLVAASIRKPVKFDDVGLRAQCMRWVVEAVLGILHDSATSPELPLNYRGAIAAGACLINGDIFVGPAVDEAAEWYEKANGAFVFLTPSAMQTGIGSLHHLTGWAPCCPSPGPSRGARVPYEYALRPLVIEYAVPIKGSIVHTTLAVDPLVSAPRCDCDGVAAGMCKAFMRCPAGSPFAKDVAVKRKNTLEFLAVCTERLLTLRSTEGK